LIFQNGFILALFLSTPWNTTTKLPWLESHPTVKDGVSAWNISRLMPASTGLKKIYKHTEVLALNREEAVNVSGGDHDNLHDLFNKLHELGPKIVLNN
jgi:hypothetical protein